MSSLNFFRRGAGKPAPAEPADTPGLRGRNLQGTLIARGLTKSYRGRKVVDGATMGVRAGEGRPSDCSGPTVPARPPVSTWSPASCPSTRAIS